MTAAPQQRQSDRRVLRLLWVLQGHTLDGVRLKQAADALGVSMPMALRDLTVLAEEGLAERIPGRDECWRLTPKLVQLARAHSDEMQRARQRIDDLDNRYTRAI